MQLKILSRKTLLILALVSFAFSLLSIFYFSFKDLIYIKKSSVSKKTVTSSESANLSSGLPVRLKIPKINVDTFLESVGLTSEGAIGTPKIQEDAAWFNPGPRPGEIGTAIITGHYGYWLNGKGSVFDNLYRLREGDLLYVEDDKGQTSSFVIRKIQRYDASANATEVLTSSDGKSHLNLITCEGTWNNLSKSYSQRLVIFADINYFTE
jgi:LPXTG-site transpeptidase (sortase) family protein